MRKTLMIAATAFLIAANAQAQDSSVEFIAKQEAGEHLASRIVGTTVMNPGGETLGGVNDLIVDGSGQVKGVVIGIGGFLGIAQKNVAVAYDSLTSKTESDGKTVMILEATKETLQKAPDFLTADDKPLSVTKRLQEQATEIGERAKKAYEKAKDTMLEGEKGGGEAQ